MAGECRTCMSSNKPVRSLFEVDNDLIEFHVKLYTCFPTFNFDDSDFPKAMCTTCIKMLRNAYKFRELCIKSTSAFLKKRKNKKLNAATKKEAAKSSTENEQSIHDLKSPTPTINNNPDISNKIETFLTPDKLNISDTIEPQSSVAPKNNSSNELSEKENISSQTSSADLATNEISENTESVSSVNFANDKINAVKKCIKVYPLNPIQHLNSESESNSAEHEILNENSSKEEHTNDINLKLNQNEEEILNLNVAQNKDSLQDVNTLDIVVIQNQDSSNNTNIEENELVYRITLVDENESQINNEKVIINETIQKNETVEKQSENNTIKIHVDDIATEKNSKNENISKNCLQNNSLAVDETRLENNTDYIKEDDSFDDSLDNDTNLLKPLENYEENNFIKSTLMYDELIYEFENTLRDNYIEEQLEIQDEVIISNQTEETHNLINTVCKTNTIHENDLGLTPDEIELEKIVHSMSDFKIGSVESLNEPKKNIITVGNFEDFQMNLLNSTVNDNIAPVIVPIPIAKLLDKNSDENNKSHVDEVDDLVNKNVIETYDFTNHNDHTYAKKLFDDKPSTNHLPGKRKRKTALKVKTEQDIEFDTPSKVEPIPIKKRKRNVDPSNSKKPVKRRGRAKASTKKTISKEIDSTSNLVQTPVVSLLKANISSNLVENPENFSLLYTNISSNLVQEPDVPLLKTNISSNSVQTPDVALRKTDLGQNVCLTRTDIQTNLDNPDISLKLTDNSATLTGYSDDSLTQTDSSTLTAFSEDSTAQINSSLNSVGSQNNSPEKITMPRRSYGTRANSLASDVTKTIASPTNKNAEWKVRKVRSRKNSVEPIKIKIRNIAIKTKISPEEYKLIRRTRTPKNKNIKTETIESKPVQNKEQETAPKVLIKRAKLESKNNQKPDTPTKKVNEVMFDMALEYPFECGLCAMRLETLPDLKAHLATMHINKTPAGKISCVYCDRSFINLSGYKSHTRRIHNDQLELASVPHELYTCEVCNKVFQTRRSLLIHKKVHKFKQ